MDSLRILCFVAFIASSYQFTSVRQVHQLSDIQIVRSTSLSSTKEDTYTIRSATGDELPRCAGFLAKSMYPSSIPAGQAKELVRLELNDLRDRYGALVGKRKFPSAFIVAVEDEELIGSVGLDCQYFDVNNNRFRPVKANREIDTTKEIVVVLANLAVRRDKRKQGIARKLLTAVEELILEDESWGQKEVYLLVDSENLAAQKLYKKAGYKLIFEDPDATCVASGDFSLKTQDCTNFCFRKTLTKQSVAATGGNPLEALSGFFNSIFGKK